MLRALADATLPKLAGFSPRGLVATFHAFAALQLRHVALWQALSKRAFETVEDFTLRQR